MSTFEQLEKQPHRRRPQAYASSSAFQEVRYLKELLAIMEHGQTRDKP